MAKAGLVFTFHREDVSGKTGLSDNQVLASILNSGILRKEEGGQSRNHRQKNKNESGNLILTLKEVVLVFYVTYFFPVLPRLDDQNFTLLFCTPPTAVPSSFPPTKSPPPKWQTFQRQHENHLSASTPLCYCLGLAPLYFSSSHLSQSVSNAFSAYKSDAGSWGQAMLNTELRNSGTAVGKPAFFGIKRPLAEKKRNTYRQNETLSWTSVAPSFTS